jgi:serine/threonine-protein kinase
MSVKGSGPKGEPMIGNLIGNYKIVEKIGEGGMGAVYKGIDTMLERDVAIKALRPELARQPHIVERFRAEAVTLAKLSHPNIATLHTFLREVDDYFMVMEFVRGETLDSVLRRAGGMPVDRGVNLFCQALEGIDHAHKMGIVHRDIKPANIMLTDWGSIKVMDFGIARVLGSARMTKQGNIIGTIEYMSPEQVRGQETDARSDIYSLGMLLYEMLTGRVPFDHNSEYELMRSQIEDAPTPPRDFAPHIPLPVEEAIMRSLAKKAEARFQSAGEFRKALLASVPAITTSSLGVASPPLPYQGPQFGQTIEGIVSAPGQPSRETTPMPSYPFSANTADHMSIPGDLGQQAGMSGAALLKDTRLGASTAAAKETRLGATAGQEPVPGAGAQNYTHQQGIQAHSRGVGAPTRKLNWKHYMVAGALACLVLVAAAVVAAVVLMRKPAQANKNPMAAPSQDIRGQETVQPQAGGQPGLSGPGAVTVPSPEPTATDRGKRGDKGSGLPIDVKPGNDDTMGQGPSADPSPSVEPTKPRETHAQAPTAPREKPSSGGKQASAEDNKEKKGKLGGLFKKIGGILKGDDKDKDKKQD